MATKDRSNTLSEIPAASSPRVARLAFGLVAGFLVLLVALHFLEPEFDPSWRWISEYELGHFGWMMSLAFFLWGGGALALLAAVWPSLHTFGGYVGRWWLLLISISLVGAGIFITDPITDVTPSTAGNLHSLCGMFTILTFPIMATLFARSLNRNPAWIPARRRLFWVTLLTWGGQFVFFGSLIASVAINHPATGLGPQILVGWPNRLMVLTYSLWLMTVARDATRMSHSEEN